MDCNAVHTHSSDICRLPYAVMKSSNLLTKLQKRLGDRHGNQDVPLEGYLDNMIAPKSLDSYLTAVGKPKGKLIVDFRKSYIPKETRYRDKETVSYDSRQHVDHPRRLLLSAECQIGKTGVYLALLQDLQYMLRPHATVAVALPEFDSEVPLPGSEEEHTPRQEELPDVRVNYEK